MTRRNAGSVTNPGGGAFGPVLSVAAVAGALALWELLSRTGILPTRVFPAMSQVASELPTLVGTAAFWHLLAQTMLSWLIGMLLATAIALPVGIAVGANETLFRATRVVLDALRSVPPIVLIPLFILLAGATMRMKLMIIVWATIWPLIIQTVYGVRDLNPVAIETTRAFRVTRWNRFVRVRLPGALPIVWTGLRLAAATALLAAVVAELIGGASGLGNAILKAQEGANLPAMYALIIVVGTLGSLISGVFVLLEKKTLHWHASVRSVGR